MVDSVGRGSGSLSNRRVGNKDPDFQSVPARLNGGQVFGRLRENLYRKSEKGKYDGICLVNCNSLKLGTQPRRDSYTSPSAD